MGYTHYWRIKNALNKEDVSKFSKLCKKAHNYYMKNLSEFVDTDEFNGRICNGSGIGNPVFTDECVCFNGSAKNNEDYETFYIGVDTDKFDFCKTARMPYDSLVCACLILAENVFGDNITVSSDGEREDDDECSADEGWVLGKKIADAVLKK